MHLIGRYDEARWWTPMTGRLGAPVILDYQALDRKQPALRPAGGHEWWKSPRGVWHQVQDILASERGVVGYDGAGSYFSWSLGIQSDYAQSFANNISLNSAYIAGVSGAAVGHSFMHSDAKTVSKIYFLISSYTGTAGNVNDLNVTIYNDNAGAPNTGSVVANSSGSVDPASNTSWVSVSGLTASLSAATRYWVSLSDNDGTAIDFAIVRNRDGAGYVGSNNLNVRCHNTTTGWVSVTNNLNGGSYIVVVFSDGSAIGCPFSTAVTPTSNTLYRGMYCSGFTETLSLLGFAGALNVAATAVFSLFDGTTGPTGTALATGVQLWQTVAGTSNAGACIFSGGYTLAKSTPYRFVAKSSANTTWVRVYGPGTVGIGSASDIFTAAPGLGGWYYTEATAAPAWGNDNTAAFPMMNLLVRNQIEVSAPASTIFVQSGGGGMAGSYYA